MNLKQLAEPFDAKDVEWRAAQTGKTGAGKPWIKVLAYLTNRAIMQRLDDVCGPENWRNEFRYEKQGAAVLCGISVRPHGDSDQWVTKWDGADETDIEATKGGLSSAMKRAAVQWGIGRYLYDLEEGWGVIASDDDKNANYVGANQAKGIPAFRWNPPKLPAWALPKVETVARGAGSDSRPSQSDRTQGDNGPAPAPAPSSKPKGGEKKVPLAQRNVDMLMKKANGQIGAVAEIVARIIPGSAVTHEAHTWPRMDADTYHAIVTDIETLEVPDSVLAADMLSAVAEALAHPMSVATHKVRILAESQRLATEFDDEKVEAATVISVCRDWLRDLGKKLDLE